MTYGRDFLERIIVSCCAFFVVGFLASRHSGFLASWLLGFAASMLFGLLASWLLGSLASWLLLLLGLLAS